QLQNTIHNLERTIASLENEYEPLRKDVYVSPATRFGSAMELFANRLSVARAYEHCLALAREDVEALKKRLSDHQGRARLWHLLQELVECSTAHAMPTQRLADHLGIGIDALDEIFTPARQQRQQQELAKAQIANLVREEQIRLQNEYRPVDRWAVPKPPAIDEAERDAKMREDAKNLTDPLILLKRLFDFRAIPDELEGVLSNRPYSHGILERAILKLKQREKEPLDEAQQII